MAANKLFTSTPIGVSIPFDTTGINKINCKKNEETLFFRYFLLSLLKE